MITHTGARRLPNSASEAQPATSAPNAPTSGIMTAVRTLFLMLRP
jgi:hypothetical protein